MRLCSHKECSGLDEWSHEKASVEKTPTNYQIKGDYVKLTENTDIIKNKHTQAYRHHYVTKEHSSYTGTYILYTCLHTHTNTHLFLVAYSISRLQAPLQEGEAQLVYRRSVEVVLHEAVTGKEESQQREFVTFGHLLKTQLQFLCCS